MNIADTWNLYSDNPDILRFVAYLHDRYEDEKEYESWDMYDEAIKKKIPNVIKTYHDPIRFDIQCDDGALRIRLQHKGNMINFSAAQVK